MTTKVNKLMKLYNMQSHNANKIVKLLDNHLPKRSYTTEIVTRCNKKDITTTTDIVKEVRLFRTKNILVLNLIVEFAQEHEAAHKKLQKSISN